MFGLTSPMHIAILLMLALILFGAKRLPEIGRSMGSGMREFKDSLTSQPASPMISASPALVEEAPSAVAPPAEANLTAGS